MTIFGFTQEELQAKSTTFTATEIHQQPATWKKTINQVKEMKDQIQTFLNQVLTQEDYDIILTGAGTSEFVGNTLFSYLNKSTNYKTKSYATTDITATPENYISQTKPTLLISFGRSGNSPESIGAVDAAEAVTSNIYHLFVTCNKNGALSKRAEGKSNCLAINLTDETHDQSFAMTSSFTNMYLATLLSFNLTNLDETVKAVEDVIACATKMVETDYTVCADVVKAYDFKRIVYLGSNALKGIAQESSLKLLELTAGQIVTMYDTPLGFRHGPKSIIDNDTLTVIYLSDEAYTRQYEIDLIKEMSGQRKGNKIFAVCNTPCEEVKALTDFYYCYNGSNHDNIFLGLEYIVVAQILALFKSLSLDITPDNPCPSGEVNRVVKGVTLYQYSK
ncbi:SIS domain-containing protein [Anaerorhabdus furcosa]|uniref:Galactosamine 6-phosphate isomerase AgaS n=1 Tax=Anaerorhabdus furcosa TaxID=118967 RepID=A0A1T4P335_9FIRM|nr:SIS domain-containing protein [Anaerorhabdus furcosa]SJZ85686.1 galactosamine 6-phosphate isomerase AgaS [Anaerorhabdus furcosa]